MTYSRDNEKRMSRTRHIARLVCILFVAASLFSAAFIFTQVDHEHDQDGLGGTCRACAQVMAAGNMLKTFVVAAIAVAASFSHDYVVAALNLGAPKFGHFSLVSYKVQLNN